MEIIKKGAIILLVMSLVCPMFASAQNGGFKIITGHPDLKIKVLRCEASGSICVIDLLLQNIGGSDIKEFIIGGGHPYGFVESKAYDDEGNIYCGDVYGTREISVGTASELTTHNYCYSLPSGVPVKARIQLIDVPEGATSFPRIELNTKCSPWQWFGHTIKFFNVPISREGDE